MSAAHTPGPWTADAAGVITAERSGVRYAVAVCPVMQLPDVEMHANAKLIQASPELSTFAQRFLDFFNLDTTAFIAKHGHGWTTKRLGDEARFALTRAGVLP